MDWIKTEEREPLAGEKIMAKLKGNKVYTHIVMTVREGEGLGHIEEWTPLYVENNDTNSCHK